MSDDDPAGAGAGAVAGRKRGAAKKLSDEKVREIRRLAKQPCPMCDAMPTLRSLAARFDVSAPTILEIIERRSWAHVGEEPPRVAASEEQRLADAAALLGRHKLAWASDDMLRFAAEVIEATRREATGGRRATDVPGGAPAAATSAPPERRRRAGDR